LAGEKKPLILLEEDANRILRSLEPFQRATRSRANLVMDLSGHSLAQTGDPQVPLETIAAFVAASTTATRQVASILAPDEFLTLTHPGKNASIQLTKIADGVVLATVFDAKTTVGAIVFYLKELVEQLAAIIKEASSRERKPVDLGAHFDEGAKGALDDFFGESGTT
jgi:predicted regulator of Ras-like GTPase activity (Roadblock/LC7/MglB family)